MIETLNAITPIFLIIATGYLLFRTRVVDESVWSAIEHICFYLLLPFLIIRTLSRANLGSVPLVDFMTVIVVAVLGIVHDFPKGQWLTREEILRAAIRGIPSTTVPIIIVGGIVV